MSSRVMQYIVAKGDSLFIPKVAARTLTARTRGTHDGDDITFSAISGTKATMTKRFSYDAFALGFEALNDMSNEQVGAQVLAEITQIEMALANDIDAQLLGLHASATAGTVTATGGIDASKIREGVKLLRLANAPLPYFFVVHENEWDSLAAIDILDN